LAFLSNAMQYVLTFFYNLTVSIGYANYGLAIILLTIALKFVLFPLTVSQVKSMKEMAFIQPKMKELQEKYKGNPEKLNKEMADLYKNHKINPLAGCLPLLVQMPFLIAIFYAIQGYQYVGEPGFLWLSSLAAPDPTYVLPVLSAATTYLQTKLFTAPEQQEQQKMMLIFMPIFILWISLSFPAGLVLYWVVGNVVQIVQQYYLYKKPLVTQGEA
jgi:YidC/Oxa1 family membrane protein insertase